MERLSLQEQGQESKEQGQESKEQGQESKEQREGHEQEVQGQEVTADSLQLLLASCIRPGPQQVSHINRSDFGLHTA